MPGSCSARSGSTSLRVWVTDIECSRDDRGGVVIRRPPARLRAAAAAWIEAMRGLSRGVVVRGGALPSDGSHRVDHAFAAHEIAHLDKDRAQQRGFAHVESRAKQRDAERTQGSYARATAEELDRIQGALQIGEQVLQELGRGTRRRFAW